MTSKGDTAFEVCEYQDSEEEEEDEDSEEEAEVELVEHITDEKAAKPTKEQEAEEAEASGSGSGAVSPSVSRPLFGDFSTMAFSSETRSLRPGEHGWHINTQDKLI